MKMNDATKSKYTKEPVMFGCIARFPRAMMAIAKVSADGCKKHDVPMGDMSYMELPDAYNLYTDALGRHLVKEQLEGLIDPEFGHLHAAHAAWDALARLEVALAKLEDEEAAIEQAAGEAAHYGDTWDRPPLNLHGVDETGEEQSVFDDLLFWELEPAEAPSPYSLSPADKVAFKPSHPDIKTGFDFPKFPTHGEIYLPLGTSQRWRYEGNGQWVNLAAFTEKGQPISGEKQFAGSLPDKPKYEDLPA